MVCPKWWEIIRKYDFKETINKSEYCPHSLYTKDNKNDHRKIKYFCNYISANNVNFKTRLNLTQFTFNQYKFCVANRLVIFYPYFPQEKKWKFCIVISFRKLFLKYTMQWSEPRHGKAEAYQTCIFVRRRSLICHFNYFW